MRAALILNLVVHRHGWGGVHDTSTLNTQVIFEDIAPGAQVWFTAAWKNPTGQQGPSGNVIGTRVQGPTILLPGMHKVA